MYIVVTMNKKTSVKFFVLLVSLTMICFTALYRYKLTCAPNTVPVNGPTQKDSLSIANNTEHVEHKSGQVYACVFTGRWMFLRVLLPYLYRELRQNGGVVDRVLFAMLGYTNDTQVKLQHFSTAANSILQDEVFQFVYLRKDPTETHDQLKLAPFYTEFYYVVLQRLLQNPNDVYFKMDDEMVYLHPNVFGSMLKNKNTSDCFIHFGNIVTNWRCNWFHQEIGVFDKKVNPKGLKIEYNPFGECGWKNAECTEMVLRAFLHHYHKKQLSKYLVPGRSLTTKGHRFSINFFLLDVDIVNIKQMMELGPIRDDELWWSSKYSGKASQPNCIVGEALMVHFSYSTTVKQMLELGFLKEFENIVLMELGEALPRELWNATDFF